MKFKATTGLALALTLLSASHALAEKAGVAAAVNPDAQGTPPGEPTRYLQLGLDVARNEHIVTSKSGLTQLLFNDGSTLSLGPDADVTIDEFVYNPQTGTGKMALTLGKGVMRLVGGQIANSSDVSIKTPAATIGIRGAIGGVAVDPDGKSTAYLAYGNHLSVAGQSGPPQVVTHGNFAVQVVPGQPASSPVPLSASVLQVVGAGLEPPAGSSGGSKSAPTEQSVKGSTGSGSPLTAPPPPAPPAPTNTTASSFSYNRIAQTASQQSTTTAILAPDAQVQLAANTTYGPYLFNSYRFLQTTGFSTDANGVITSAQFGPVSFSDPDAAALLNTTAGYTDTAIGTPTDVVKAGQAQVGIWLGDVQAGEVIDPQTGLYKFGTVTSNLPGLYVFAVPTTSLPQSGYVTYKPIGSTRIVNSYTNTDGVSSGSILPGSYLGNPILTAYFGAGGPNTAKLTFAGDLVIPNDGTLHITDTMVNYPLTRFFFFTSSGSTGTVAVDGTSSYCNNLTVCTVSTQGYFSGAGGLAQIALGYYVYYSDANGDGGQGFLSGGGVFQFNSSSPGAIGPDTVGFAPNSIVAAAGAAVSGRNISKVSFDTVLTGPDGSPASTSFVPVAGSGHITEQGGDAYAQAVHLTGNYLSQGFQYATPAGGLHQILAIPTIDLPTSGTTSYTLFYADSPTYTDGSGAPGHLSSTPMTVAFSPKSLNITTGQMTVAMPDATYVIQPTQINNVTSAIFASTASVSAPGSTHLCSDCGNSNYIANLKGILSGPNALRAALLYSINAGGSLALNGAAIYRH